jgi:hypothetical protein
MYIYICFFTFHNQLYINNHMTHTRTYTPHTFTQTRKQTTPWEASTARRCCICSSTSLKDTHMTHTHHTATQSREAKQQQNKHGGPRQHDGAVYALQFLLLVRYHCSQQGESRTRSYTRTHARTHTHDALPHITRATHTVLLCNFCSSCGIIVFNKV